MSTAPEPPTADPPAATAAAVAAPTPDQIAAFTHGVADFGRTLANAAQAVARVLVPIAQAFAAEVQVAGDVRVDEGRRLLREYRRRPDSPADHARYVAWMAGEGGGVGDRDEGGAGPGSSS